MMQQQNYSYGHAAKIASVHMSVRKPAYTQTQKFKSKATLTMTITNCKHLEQTAQ